MTFLDLKPSILTRNLLMSKVTVVGFDLGMIVFAMF